MESQNPLGQSSSAFGPAQSNASAGDSMVAPDSGLRTPTQPADSTHQAQAHISHSPKRPTPSETRNPTTGTDGNAGAGSEPTTKRRRKALACYDCRRRKLKCDRLWPACSRCMKAGQPNACRYDSVPSPGQAGGGAGAREDSTSADEAAEVGCTMADAVHILAPRQLGVTSGLVRRARGETGAHGGEVLSKTVHQARRIERLEERVAQLEARNAGPYASQSWPRGGDSDFQPKSGRESLDMMFLKGNGVRTIYYGSSQPTSMISQFPELRTFMKDTIMQYPSLARAQSELRILNLRAKTISDASARGQPLLPLVPSKASTDRMVYLYLDTVERLYRILHLPTFQQDYAAFWEDPKGAKPGFVAILLLMLSCVISMSSESPIRFVGKSSVAREKAITWTTAVESWLDKQSYKHGNISRYQICILLDMAKHINSIKKKRHWETSGKLLRFGMAVGLHRDPGLLIGKMTFFEDQMRRRLWATMVEWELQAAVTRGFPAESSSIPSDCPSPLNLDDESFAPGTVHPPTQKDAQVHTNTSFLHVSQKSLKLRRQLNTLVNDFTAGFSYEDVLAYEEKIMHEIEAIPTWDDDGLPGAGSNSYLLETVVLDVQLRQYLIWLHFPFASRTDTRYSYSKTACFNAASTILDQHSKLMAQGEYTLCLLRNDGYLAALCICHNVFASSLLRSDIVFKSLNISFSQFVENALSMLEEKVMRLGECRNHHWFISAAYSFVQAKVSPETAHLTKQQAVDRATRLFYRILASQDESLRLGALTPSMTGTSGASPNNVGTGAGTFSQVPQVQPAETNTFAAINTPQAAESTDLQTMDPLAMFDLSEWALDNLWPIDNMNMF